LNNYYQDTLRKIEDNKYLISMIQVDEILRFGYEAGLNKNSKVLDLCCGYGTVLKVWNQAFGITGIGVDLNNDFLETGRKRIKQSEAEDKIKLICDDVLKYTDVNKYDVVICSETFGSIKQTLALGEKFLKQEGILAYNKVYSKIPNPPRELLDFEGEVLPLSELNRIFKELGYYLISMSSDTDAMWEHYAINWNNAFDNLKKNPNDENLKLWYDKWHNIYFNFRRPYEGQALFGLVKL